MSKNAKAQSKKRRLDEKRARKAAQRARYERYRLDGRNTKSKRAKSQNKRGKRAKTVDHPEGKCGNVACIKCNGLSFRGFLNSKGAPDHMPQWMYQQFKEQRSA